MTQQTDKYGNVIVDEQFDVNGNRIYQKLRKIGGDILEQFYKYDANNKIVYCKRVVHIDKKQFAHELFYEYGVDGKRIFEKFVEGSEWIERRYDYDREVVHITRRNQSTQSIPMAYKQLDLFGEHTS